MGLAARAILLGALLRVDAVVEQLQRTLGDGPRPIRRRDKLAQVQARGTLVLWTDPDYAPAVVHGREGRGPYRQGRSAHRTR